MNPNNPDRPKQAESHRLNLPELMTVPDVKEHTHLSQATLARWRAEGIGPRFIRIGRSVRYRRDDVLAWIESAASEPA